MVRRTPQPEATREAVLECVQQTCPICGGWMWNKYDNFRRVRTLRGVVQLRLKVRRCATPECERCCQPYRPEAEGKWALPQHEFGLDVIALVGNLGCVAKTSGSLVKVAKVPAVASPTHLVHEPQASL